MTERRALLSFQDVTVTYPNGAHGVGPVSLEVHAGELVSIVGESGSGKSTLVRRAIGLLPRRARSSGRVLVSGADTADWSEADYARSRGWYIGFVPQDPGVALNPVKIAGRQVADAVRANAKKDGRAVTGVGVSEEVDRLLLLAGLRDPRSVGEKLPHELSGGMRQRVLIAIALAGSPQLLVADEPTSALDVTVQRHILDHLDRLRRELHLGILLVTHDLGVAIDRSDRIVVMRAGRAVETGSTEQIAGRPRHDYTRSLFAAIPGDGAGVRVRDALPVVQANGDAGVAVRAAGVHRSFRAPSGEHVPALTEVDLTVARGSTHALVGESGAGKSTLARIVGGLERADAGSVEVLGVRRGDPAEEGLRRRVQFVYQNPFSSLDPRFKLVDLVTEPLRIHRRELSAAGRRTEALDLLAAVRLPAALAGRRVGELSGGQAQRVAIARALAIRPELVILDEAVSALDVSVQASILDLLGELQRELSLTYLFVTHDLGVVRAFADEATVLRHGRVVEHAPVERLFALPEQDYTRELLEAIPGRRKVHA